MATGGRFATSQTDASDALYDFPCSPSAKDGKNVEAMFQCMDCQIFYCHTCVTGHNKFTENHNVVDKSSKLFDQGQGKRYLKSFSSSELPSNLCEEHQGEVIKLFCGQHDVVCCTVCVAVKHRSCTDVEYIPNIANRLLEKQGKDKTKLALEKVKDDLQNLKSKKQRELEELNVQRDGIIDDIEKFKRDLIAQIEDLETNTIKEVQDKYKEIEGEINTSSKKINGILKDVEEHIGRLYQFESNNEAQLFVAIKIGEKKISDGNDCVRQATAKKSKRWNLR
ncbi:E3 ubiquitin-protein ligase Midline-1-like [Mercenaria mercenaria]|uniref:E3 ubiquitin-protein ligase Midline-1-like n=1 Tax=Mercenaria mercenaria TaxID=6596 RepID=UPI00234F0372|nr:E3 ubiquitin-protein ligase Midline-1-like [Mercenaria mercenaria]